jgi:hypothetical protein
MNENGRMYEGNQKKVAVGKTKSCMIKILYMYI